jgi:hypothetical protein
MGEMQRQVVLPVQGTPGTIRQWGLTPPCCRCQHLHWIEKAVTRGQRKKSGGSVWGEKEGQRIFDAGVALLEAVQRRHGVG